MAVLFIWFTIQCWCNGWSNSQWENCWFHWAKRGEGFLGSHGDMNIICRLWTNLWFCYRWWQAIAYNWFSYFHYTYYKPLALVSMLLQALIVATVPSIARWLAIAFTKASCAIPDECLCENSSDLDMMNVKFCIVYLICKFGLYNGQVWKQKILLI